jgi:hypothetical protein
MKKRLSIKQRILKLGNSSFGRLIITCISIVVFCILATNDIMKIESPHIFWDCILYMGALSLFSYFSYGIYYAIKNAINDMKNN